jgi:xylan 1,4-beta-xylosidase
MNKKLLYFVLLCMNLSLNPLYAQQKTYQNPILPGDFGDPSIVLAGKDYVLAKSTGDGFIIMQSRDLVHWKPVLRHHFSEDIRKVWAVDLQYFNGKFHLYIPVGIYKGSPRGSYINMVVISDKPEGPWSEPVDLEIKAPEGVHFPAIDPGLIVTPEGKKYLYVSQGYVVELNAEGTKAMGVPRKVYDGWPIPDDWNVECMCLESPKLFYKDGYYFMVSAQGGTNGPSTAHMSVVARSKSPTGPWENSPYNPLTRTYSQDEKWWQQGHGTIFKAINGSWWTIYHARLNGFTEIGRQGLLMPVIWTKDGWPIQKKGVKAGDRISYPGGEIIGNGIEQSDNFFGNELGIQWLVPEQNRKDIQVGNGRLILKAKGADRNNRNSLTVRATHPAFEVQVEIRCDNPTAVGGIEVGGTGVATNGLTHFLSEGKEWRLRDKYPEPTQKGRMWFKIVNLRKDLAFYYSFDGEVWHSYGKGLRVNDSYRIELFAGGTGEVQFSNFIYKAL